MTSYLEGKLIPLSKKSRDQLELEFRDLQRENQRLQFFYDLWSPFVNSLREICREEIQNNSSSNE